MDSVTSIQFVGSGNIQKSLNSGEEIPANTGIGVIYRETLHGKETLKWLYNFELALNINIASTVDTLKPEFNEKKEIINQRDFGNSILLPSNSGQSFNLSFKGYFSNKDTQHPAPKPILSLISGFYVNLTGANRNWAYDSTYARASVISFQAGIFHDFVDRDQRQHGYSITMGLGYTGRFLMGDVAHSRNMDVRKSLLGTTSTSFHGVEFSLAITLKNIRASVRIPYLYAKDEVPGLSGVQPNTIIGFVGGFSLEL